MILTFVGFFTTVFGCLYTELVGIGHSGSLTDYGTIDDEINMGIMVGNWLTIGYIQDFIEGEKTVFPKDRLRFPCFQKEAMTIHLTERDDREPESAQVSLRCDSLQVGINDVVIELYENSEALETVSTAFKDVLGTSWSFFDDAVGKNNPAIYTITFNVTEECIKAPINSKEGELKGFLAAFDYNRTARYEQIDLEEWDPEPLIILQDGTTKRLDSSDLTFGDFVAEQSFMKEFLENPEKFNEEQPEEEKDWK